MQKSHLKILLVEADAGDACFLQEMVASVAWGVATVTWASDLAEARTFLAERQFDVVISELNLPESRGLNTLNTIANLAPNMPVIVISEDGQESLKLDAIRLGAQAYLIKWQIGGRELVNTIRRSILRGQVESSFAIA